jgi:hypothetical protein
LGTLLYATPHIGNIMGEITPVPSLMSILVHGGVRVDLRMDCVQATAAERDWPALADGRSAYRLPFVIDLNGEPALRCCVIVAESQPPLRLCSGLVGLEGADVRQPEHRFTVRLLAARLRARQAHDSGDVESGAGGN